MVQIMGIINLTPDSFWAPSRYNMEILDSGADMIDVGAVSTRPGYTPVPLEEEWSRLESFLKNYRHDVPLSIDTTSAEIVRRAYRIVGPFIVNDISAGEADTEMLPLVGELGLRYIAMHSHSMKDTGDVVDYFRNFEKKAAICGIEDWILDPGFGFDKEVEDNLLLMDHLGDFKQFGRKILIGIADKRFTKGRTEYYHFRAIRGGADILRVHDVKKARGTAGLANFFVSPNPYSLLVFPEESS